ncbi:hypothetical protein A1O7_02871 [Cladophialophora yegresii CBS 114405]|uniref:Uncharacterized protein n=1 Tax=Cladophialophora yegresii CBS 114405 TaxID=1182544 RepID=W9WD01_9EURO|nr:uncharacterized protein A1O7_02871 [Cladophialophora yegresii CBS 114405]EXJ62436.1 hypothetical protein A1O7_02871 [Cladophialophora yegresii CBS 114405]
MATFRIFRQLQRQCHSTLSMKRFTGLCAYLSVALDHGYPLPDHAFDLFFTSHPSFGGVASDPLGDVSYHTWLIERPTPTVGLHRIVTRDGLGAIAEENPFTFTLTRRKLDKWMHKKDFSEKGDHKGKSAAIR